MSQSAQRTLRFDLKRPCKDCPFRTDHPPYLTRARATEIADALLHDRTFSCHATNEFDDDGDVTEEPQHCAGATIFLELQERPNQWMRWMERIGFYDRSTMDLSAPVFRSKAAFVRHHANARKQK